MTLRWFFLFFFFVRNVCLINWIFISIGQAYFKEIKYFFPIGNARVTEVERKRMYQVSAKVKQQREKSPPCFI